MSRGLSGILFALVLAGCTGLFFQPHRVRVLTPETFALPYDDVYFKSADGVALHAWFLPARGEAIGTVLFLHGNAENISTHIASVYWLPERRFNVLLLDYRGYGASEGSPSLPGIVRDIESAIGYLLERHDVDPQRIVVFGQSLGGALGIYAVTHSRYRNHVRALVVESTFTAYRAIAREKLASFWLTWPFQWPLAWTVRDDYSPIRFVKEVSPIPLLIVHGEQDSIIPVHHARELFAAAREPKALWLVAGAKHIGVFRSLEYRDRLVSYLTRVLRNPTPAKQGS